MRQRARSRPLRARGNRARRPTGPQPATKAGPAASSLPPPRPPRKRRVVAQRHMKLVTPSSAARAFATVPVTRIRGCPLSSTHTSASVHRNPPGAPALALAMASFAANRAARRERPPPLAARQLAARPFRNSRSAIPGVRSRGRREPLDLRNVDADPDDAHSGHPTAAGALTPRSPTSPGSPRWSASLPRAVKASFARDASQRGTVATSGCRERGWRGPGPRGLARVTRAVALPPQIADRPRAPMPGILPGCWTRSCRGARRPARQTGTTTTTGTPSSIRAIGPRFSSPAAKPSALHVGEFLELERALQGHGCSRRAVSGTASVSRSASERASSRTGSIVSRTRSTLSRFAARQLVRRRRSRRARAPRTCPRVRAATA